MAGLMLVVLLSALDQTIVAVAMPQLAADLQGFGLLAWVVSGYLIAAAVAMPIYGKLGDLFGRRRTLALAIALFLLSSLACAVAQSMAVLVAARVLQGIGAGGLIAISQAVVADVVAPRERGRYQGYFSITYAVASVAGPLVGGLLTHYLNWRWVFWINLPLALLAIVITGRALGVLPIPRLRRRIDYLGAATLTGALSALLVAVTRAGQGEHWLGGTNTLLFALALALLALFVWQERRHPEPLLPLRLLRLRTVLLCCLVAFVGFFQIVSLSVLLPLQFQTLTGADARQAALMLIPFTLATPLGAFFGGRHTSEHGKFKPVILLGNALVAAGLLGYGFTDVHHTLTAMALLALAGFGIGMQFPATMVGVQNAVPRQDIGVATATVSFVRSFGAAVGVAVQTSILLAALAEHAPVLPEALSGASMLRDLIGGHLPLADAALRQQLLASASTAFRNIFLVSGMLALAALAIGSLLHNDTLRGPTRT